MCVCDYIERSVLPSTCTTFLLPLSESAEYAVTAGESSMLQLSHAKHHDFTAGFRQNTHSQEAAFYHAQQ